MTKVGFLKFIVVILLAHSAYGQKVKYKDIFALLSTKQYEPAEPFLKRYLKDNDDNPNAYLFMGIVFQEKAMKMDILRQSHLAVANMDSAIIFYDKALKTIDEREVRKNKEYYQSYNRRDLRTGEFGVKHSDVQFDLEKRIEGLKERIDRVKMVNHYFTLADTLYKKSNVLFRSIQEGFPSERQLYLRADENTVKDLKMLAVRFDSCMKAFEGYKTSSANLGKTGYNQNMILNEIENFKKDGTDLAVFYNDEIKAWDYRKFAEEALHVIEKEILPMREHLVSYDVEINKLRDKLNKDSVSVRSDLTKLIDKLLYDQLKKYDPEPLPMEVFSLKTAELEYRSTLLENKSLRDSSDVHLKLALTNKEMKLLGKLDSLTSKITSGTIDEKVKDYSDFISNTFGNSGALKNYVSELREYADGQKRTKAPELMRRMRALEWIVDGADSIPLRPLQPLVTYVPVVTLDEKYTAGLHFKDSTNASGYFYTITSARKPDIKVTFPVDKSAFKERKVPVIKGLSYADAAGQLYFVLLYSEQSSKEKYPATLAKIYRSDGLAWSNNLQLPFIPTEMLLKPDTGELTLKRDAQVAVIDKNGKIMK